MTANSLTPAQELMASINQQFGAGTMLPASDAYFKVEMLPTGLAPIDDIFFGGIPFGRHTMLHGDYSTLKTYVGFCAIASAQKMNKVAALIDTEHTFDAKWAKQLGVDTSELVMPDPDKMPTGEKAIDMCEVLVRGGVDFIVVDSVAALLPVAEQTKTMEEAKQLGRQAEMMSKALRKLTAAMRKTGILWINQTRLNPNVMFGSPETIPGGKALPFYCTYIAGLYKAGVAKEDLLVYVPGEDGKPVKKTIKQVVGNRIRVEIKKSKLNRPFREETFVYNLREGAIDDWSYLAHKALSLGLLGYDRGRWWTPEDGKKLTTPEFRGHLSLEKLKEMLQGTVLGVESAGTAPRGRKKAATPSRKSSSPTEPEPTPTAAREASRSTVPVRKPSSRSRTQSVATRSATPTSAGSVRKLRVPVSKEST